MLMDIGIGHNTTETVKVENRIFPFWEKILHDKIGDNPAIEDLSGKKSQWWKYKDIKAHANCIAAYLMNKRVKKGDRVAIVSNISPEYISIDLGLQFIGAVNFTIPLSTDIHSIENEIKEEKIKYIIILDEGFFKSNNELDNIKPLVEQIIFKSTDGEVNNPEKVITLDRVIVQGKEIWREYAQELKSRKMDVLPSDIYTLQCADSEYSKGKHAISFQSLMDAIEKIPLKSSEKKPIALNLASAHLTYSRVFTYKCLTEVLSLKTYPSTVFNETVFIENKPAFVCTTAQHLRTIYTQLPAIFGDPDKMKKEIDVALEVLKIKIEAEKAGKKPSLKYRFKYRSLNKKIYKKLIVFFGGNVVTVLKGEDHFQDEAGLLFRESGITTINIA